MGNCILNFSPFPRSRHPVDHKPVIYLERLKKLNGVPLLDTRFMSFKEIMLSVTGKRVFFHFRHDALHLISKVLLRLKQSGCEVIGIGNYVSFSPRAALLLGFDSVISGDDIFDFDLFEKEENGNSKLNGRAKFNNSRKRKARRIVKLKLKDVDDSVIPSQTYNYYSVQPLARLRRYVHGYMFTSYGCKHMCRFCSESAIRESQGKSYRQHSLEYIEAWIKKLKSKGFSLVHVLDDCFFSDIARLRKVCSLFSRYELDWTCQMRLDDFNKEVIDVLKENRCVLVKLGIESGAEEEILRMSKTSNGKSWVLMADKRVNYAESVGLNVCGMFLVGFPEHTKKDLVKTLELIRKIKPSIVQFHNFVDFKQAGQKVHQYDGDSTVKYYVLYLLFYSRMSVKIKQLIYLIVNPRILNDYVRFFVRSLFF